VFAPQVLTTQFKAEFWIAADDEHWQGKSVDAQPTAEPADMRQEFLRNVSVG